MKNNPNRKATLANLPLPVFAWLQGRKEYNGSSLSYEITRCCRAQMEAEVPLPNAFSGEITSAEAETKKKDRAPAATIAAE